jgi:hypothetical protein
MVIGIIKKQAGTSCLATSWKDLTEEQDREAIWMLEVPHIHDNVYCFKFTH